MEFSFYCFFVRFQFTHCLNKQERYSYEHRSPGRPTPPEGMPDGGSRVPTRCSFCPPSAVLFCNYRRQLYVGSCRGKRVVLSVQILGCQSVSPGSFLPAHIWSGSRTCFGPTGNNSKSPAKQCRSRCRLVWCKGKPWCIPLQCES